MFTEREYQLIAPDGSKRDTKRMSDAQAINVTMKLPWGWTLQWIAPKERDHAKAVGA